MTERSYPLRPLFRDWSEKQMAPRVPDKRLELAVVLISCRTQMVVKIAFPSL